MKIFSTPIPLAYVEKESNHYYTKCLSQISMEIVYLTFKSIVDNECQILKLLFHQIMFKTFIVFIKWMQVNYLLILFELKSTWGKGIICIITKISAKCQQKESAFSCAFSLK